MIFAIVILFLLALAVAYVLADGPQHSTDCPCDACNDDLWGY